MKGNIKVTVISKKSAILATVQGLGCSAFEEAKHTLSILRIPTTRVLDVNLLSHRPIFIYIIERHIISRQVLHHGASCNLKIRETGGAFIM